MNKKIIEKVSVRMYSDTDTSLATQDDEPKSTDVEFDISKPDELLFIGQLIQNQGIDPTLPGKFCLEDNQLWTGALYRIGRLNLYSDKPIPDRLIGKMVVLKGVRKSSLDKKIKKEGPCSEKNSILQLRNDQYSDEGGSFTTHEKLNTIDYVEFKQFAPIRTLTMPPPVPLPRKGMKTKERETDLIKDSITIVIQNPFSVEIKKVSLFIHYEGGSHKQIALYTITQVSLPPYGIKTMNFPAQIENQREDYTEQFYYQDAFLNGVDGKLVFLSPARFKIEQSSIK